VLLLGGGNFKTPGLSAPLYVGVSVKSIWSIQDWEEAEFKGTVIFQVRGFHGGRVKRLGIANKGNWVVTPPYAGGTGAESSKEVEDPGYSVILM